MWSRRTRVYFEIAPASRNEENTRNLLGIAFKLQPGDELRWRVIEYFYESSSILDETFVQKRSRLRETQPNDVFASDCKDYSTDHPAALGESSVVGHGSDNRF